MIPKIFPPPGAEKPFLDPTEPAHSCAELWPASASRDRGTQEVPKEGPRWGHEKEGGEGGKQAELTLKQVAPATRTLP